MSTTMPSDLQRSNTKSNQITENTKENVLGNLAFGLPTNPHPTDDTDSILPNKPLNKIRTYLVWSIFNLIFLPFGLLCCYLSYQVRKSKLQNRIGLANKWSKRTFVSNIMTTLLMIGVVITISMLQYDYHQRNPDHVSNDTATTAANIAWQPGR